MFHTLLSCLRHRDSVARTSTNLHIIAEIHVYGGNIILVTTRDFLSFALVYPDSFQVSPHV